MFDIYVPLVSEDRLERIEHAQAHILALLQEVLRASVPVHEVEAVTLRLKASADALQVATKSLSTTTEGNKS